MNGHTGVERNDTEIRLKRADNIEQEREYILDEATRINRGDNVVAILLPSKNDILFFSNWILGKYKSNLIPSKAVKDDNFYGIVNDYFSKANQPFMCLGSGFGDLREADRENKIVIINYHNSKGLDFDDVFVPFLSCFQNIKHAPKSLFFVALSRAKSNLYITFTKKINSNVEPFVKGIKITPVKSEQTNKIII